MAGVRDPGALTLPRDAAVMFVALPQHVGGSSRSLLTLLGELEGRCRRIMLAPESSWLLDRVRARDLADEVVGIAGLEEPRVRRPLAAFTVARVARANHRDVVAIHANGLAELNLAAVAGRISGARTVVWCHDYQVTPWARRLTPVAAAVGGATLVPVSEASRRLLSDSGIEGSRVVDPIHNPLGPETVDSGHRDPTRPVTVVAYLGAPEHYKGFDLLPAIADRLDPDIRLEVFADPAGGDQRTWANLRRAGNVDIRGVCEDVAASYRRSDIVLCPSRQESFGRVAAEAMASGVPVVASSLPALRELLAAAGTYFEAGDPDAASQAIQTLVREPGLRARVAEIGRARAAALSPTAIADALARRYGLNGSPMGPTNGSASTP